MQGKVILVTGGARRVGAPPAAACMRWEQIWPCITEARSKRTHGTAGRVEPDAAQFSRPGTSRPAGYSRLPQLVAETVKRFGKLDVLINNASSFFPTPLGEITESIWNDLIGTNLKVPLLLSQAAAPQLRENNGCIVNIVDIHENGR